MANAPVEGGASCVGRCDFLPARSVSAKNRQRPSPSTPTGGPPPFREGSSREALLEILRRQDGELEQLRQEVEKLREKNERLREKNEGLQEEIKQLKSAMAQVERRAHRSAAPFSKEQPVKQPKKPGRRTGEGPFSQRRPPAPDAVTEELEAPLPERCDCGGSWELLAPESASITDLPPDPKPEVTVFQVQVGRCRKCGRKARGRYPRLPVDQHGATAHRVGERAMAKAHLLHYGLGVPVRKVPRILEVLGGLRLTQGAVTQDALHRAEHQAGREYQALRESMAQAKIIHTDDTGWRVGGKPAQLMGFSSEEATVYQIRERHRNEEVREVVPGDYQGTMVTDRGVSYDAKELLAVKQQKCLSHAKRSIEEVVEQKKGRGRSFGKQLKGLLMAGLALWHRFWEREVSDVAFVRERHRLQEEVTEHLKPRELPDPDNQRLLDEFGWHHERGNLLRFLQDPWVPPTNNQGERELRPAVIARKVSHCSKNKRGAHAHACLSSLCRTLIRQNPEQAPENLRRVFRGEHHLVPI